MRVIVYDPAALYVWAGFCAVESTTLSPLKSHAQVVGDPDDVSVNCTDRGAMPVDGENVKLAVGGGVGLDTAMDTLFDDPPYTVRVANDARG